MTFLRLKWWQPPAFGLAAILLSATAVFAQGGTLAEKIQLCGTCHGEDGNSKTEKTPSLAGQPAFYILNQLFLMREGVRKVEPMAAIVKDLKDSDLDGLSKHYSALAPKRSDEKYDRSLSPRGLAVVAERRCGSCHLPGLVGQQQIPRIAKQRIDYLIQTLKSFRDNPRGGADTAMSAPVAGMSDDDIQALAHYLWSR
ncbi:MAG: c-type cytochrome [Hyphomicrobiales bacterium]|nr:c-type cytochrome [Alphaproteobacteria bacterium]